MGMVVRTNTMALNAYRQLGMNNSAVAKSLEKLSSGFRINRAGDDAAGLAISEKMKAQIKGLETASANAQDGISLIQTAEGNLGEVHDMLNRMVELATKSANGTYTQTERDALQAEVNSLQEEINRISQSANFNGTNLLDGTMGLNKEAFQFLEGAAATEAGTNPIASTAFSDPHVGGAAVELQKPEFSIDFADVKISGGSITLKSGGKDIQVWNDDTSKWEAYSFQDAGNEITGSAIAADLAGKDVRIGTTVYTATAADAGNGTNFGVKFAYKGYTAADAVASATIEDTAGEHVAGIKPLGDLTITPNAASFVIDDAQKEVVSDVKFTDAAGGNIKLKYDVVAAKNAKGVSDTAIAGLTGFSITGGQNDTLNGKQLTIKLAATGDNTDVATLDADGNLSITIAANADIADGDKLATAIQTAIAALSGTGDVVTAWKAVTCAKGSSGTYSAPTVGTLQELGTITFGEGTGGTDGNAAGWKVTATDSTTGTAKTAVATGVTADWVDGVELEFDGDFSGNMTVLKVADFVTNMGTTATAVGVNPANNGAAGTPTSGRVNCPAYNIKDGQLASAGSRSGISLTLSKEMIAAGNTLKIQDLEVIFVAKGEGTGAANELELDYTKGTDTDRLAQVTQFLSTKKTTDFTIGRGDGSTAKIEIEEKVPGSGASLKNYTEEQLKGMFSYKTSAKAATSVLKITNGNVHSGDTIRIGDESYTFVKEGKGSGTNGAPSGNEVLIGSDLKATLNALRSKVEANGYSATVDETAGTISIADRDAKKAAPFITGGGLTLQIGDTAATFNKMTVAVPNMGTAGLSIKDLKITSEIDASNAIDKIKAAINTVSSARANMGALQNRLEHTINNLDVSAENLSSANSRIRDTDMAKEMMNYTKMNVLVQSAQAMLAQANQQPQSVLQLLQ